MGLNYALCSSKGFGTVLRCHYGTHAFRTLEQYMRKLGITTIRLHICGENLAARSIYEKLGFLTTDVLMEKTLGKQVLHSDPLEIHMKRQGSDLPRA